MVSDRLAKTKGAMAKVSEAHSTQELVEIGCSETGDLSDEKISIVKGNNKPDRVQDPIPR